MKCTVFGGGGFIGSAIVDRLLRDGYEIRVFERPRVPPYRKFDDSERVEWLTGDLLSTHDVGNAIEGTDVVVHLVSTTLPKNSTDDPIFDVQTNIVGSIQMLNAMRAKKVPRIIFISSGGTVYGVPKSLPIDEQHPTEPQVSYGITKLAIEKYLLMYQRLYGIKATILRVANPYGERQRAETAQGAVGVFLLRALMRQPIEIWGDGSVVRDYLYVGDVADAFAKAIQYNGQQSVFNVSSGIGVSLNELLNVIGRVTGETVERRYLPARSFDVPVSVLDNSLAQRELIWTPTMKLEEGVRRTFDWMKNHLSV